MAPRAFPDRTRARTAALNQLLFGAVVLVLSLFFLSGPFTGHIDLYFGAVVVVFISTGASLVVPWNRVGGTWLALLPAADILAVTLMCYAAPNAGFGLLWIFPTMWLAGSFGWIGLVGGVTSVIGAYLLVTAVEPEARLTYSTLLLPLAIVAVAVTAHLTARRSAAQRALLDKQARLLSRALERTRAQEQELIEVLDAVDFGVIRIGSDGGIAVTNEAHARLQHAYAAAGRDGADEGEAYREDGATPMPHSELPLERALRGDAFDEELVWFGPPEGPRRALSVTARRLRGAAGDDVGAVLVSRDVTAELSALRARDELVASVSHELRTPLTSILGYLDLTIDDPAVPERVRRNLEIAERNAERLLGIVADILAASSTAGDAAAMSIQPVDVDVADVVQGAVESLLPRAAERGVIIDDSGLEPARASVDPQRLRQVVDNLVANAIKYNSDGGTVTLGTTTDGTSVLIVVRDSGVGIPEAEQPMLFQRFFRGRSVRRTGMRGTGLGLAISRDLVRAHGGDISVRSTPGVGSTFVVRLPLEPPPSAARRGAAAT